MPKLRCGFRRNFVNSKSIIQLRAFPQLGLKSFGIVDKLGKKETMDTKDHLTSSRRALDVWNESQWSQTISPMLRLIPQLLRSSEIQLFEDTVGAEEIHLAVFGSALDVRNHCLACFSERFMLWLIPQLLRSSEIQLFEGQAPLYRGFPFIPYLAQVRI